mmetsp:Transcript_14440/g.39484  ORF Transcript_14440/g.39484 Transcript_14440/m.39484 type:complete len:233 (-) Transcript_14440:288-986(-)
MSRSTLDLADNRVDNKIELGRWHLLDRALNNVISVHVFNALQDLGLQLPGQRYLQLNRHPFECFLDHTAPKLVIRQLHDLPTHLACNGFPLFSTAPLEEFLNHKVAKGVTGHVDCLGQGSFVDCVSVLLTGPFHHILQETATILFPSVLRDVRKHNSKCQALRLFSPPFPGLRFVQGRSLTCVPSPLATSRCPSGPEVWRRCGSGPIRSVWVPSWRSRRRIPHWWKRVVRRV